MDKREEFLKRIYATFIEEAEEGFQKISSHLIELENSPSPIRRDQLIEEAYREAHSLKGASRAINFNTIETLCQAMESVFSALKNKQLSAETEIFMQLNQATNLLEELLKYKPENIPHELQFKINEVNYLLLNINKNKPDSTNQAPPEPPTAKIQDTSTISQTNKRQHEQISTIKTQELTASKEKSIRVSTRKLDNLMFQAEEMQSLKTISSQLLIDIQKIIHQIQTWNKNLAEIVPIVNKTPVNNYTSGYDTTIGIKKDDWESIVDFCKQTAIHYKKLEGDLLDLKKTGKNNLHASNLKIDQFTDDVKKIISVPFATLLDVFPKTCYNLSKDLGKEIQLTIEGDDIEIDRRILETFRNPLIHILRNAVDHGIEKPEERKLKNKAAQGKIKFSISRLENSKVEICVSDDGKGIDLEKVKQKYIEKEKLSEKEGNELSNEQLIDYIFQSGLSTSQIITDLSGRGLGLAIVREKTEQLGGEIVINTIKDSGTTFTIQLPLSMVSFRGVLIRCQNQKFIIPTLKIIKVLRAPFSEIKSYESNLGITFDEKIISFTFLADILNITKKTNENELLPTLIIGHNNNRIAIAVDEILHEEEVLVKTFNKHLERVRNISGATVLGNGQVIPILNVEDLIRSARLTAPDNVQPGSNIVEQINKSILVVEDSITSRMLLRNILETAGYKVTIAIDGIDGYTKLKEGEFQLVVSDVDMPRMNGFDLTAKIRSDKKVQEIPVVLVTSLSKTEDRERGMEVGANAYIVKSSFDQSNLMEIIERLI